MYRKLLATGLIASMLAGCAGVNQPVMFEPLIDKQDVTDEGMYYTDLHDCQHYATIERKREIDLLVDQALTNALVGAVAGAAVGSLYGKAGYGAQIGAIQGGAIGTFEGVSVYSARWPELVVKRCMDGRGYRVLL